MVDRPLESESTMHGRKIAVFGTRHINAETPLFPEQAPVHELWHRGEHLRWYSTGKLEEAIALGYEVYVVSIRPTFGPHDRWWQALVEPSHVLATGGLFAAAARGDPMTAVFAPWRELFARLGVPWNDVFSDFDDPAIELSARYGVRDGSTFIGYRLLC